MYRIFRKSDSSRMRNSLRKVGVVNEIADPLLQRLVRKFRGETIRCGFAILFAIVGPLTANAGTPLQTVSLFSVPQGTSSVTQAVPVSITSGGVLASVSVVTQGVTSTQAVPLDFSDAVTGDTCSSGTTYSSNTTCNVNVQFKPTAPGWRNGAVVLTFNNGAATSTSIQYLYGMGMGSLGLIVPGEINLVAGTGLPTFVSDSTPSNPVLATQAPIGLPQGEAVDAQGNLYIADSFNYRIRRVDATTGQITTYVGTGNPGSSGDGGPATSAAISKPSGLVIDGAGNLYFTDDSSDVIRMVDATPNHIITTIAGTAGTPGYNGPAYGSPQFNLPQAAAGLLLNQPNGLALDPNRNLYVADSGNNLIRVIDLKATPMTMTTIAGSGTAGFGGDGQVISAAVLSEPWGISFTTSLTGTSYLYVADVNNNVIRRLDLTSGTGLASTVVGMQSTSGAFNGDAPTPATAANLNNPEGVAVDLAGNLYVADTANHRIRKVNAQSSDISTIAGSTQGYNGDGQNAGTILTQLDFPSSLALDASGNLFIGDEFNNRVRKISSGMAILNYGQIKNYQVSPPQAESFENDGNSTLNLLAFAFANAALDSTTTSTCSSVTTLPIGQSCTLQLDFAPQVLNLPNNPSGTPTLGTLTISSDAANSTGVVSLLGDVLTVNPTTTTVVSNGTPSALNTSVTFTATVTNVTSTSSGNGPLTGAVTFYDGGTSIGTSAAIPAGTVNSGTATFTFSTSSLALGSHNITAVYNGDLNNAPSPTSPIFIQVVKSGAVLALTSNLNPPGSTPNFPTSITFTATLTNAVNPGAATITFTNNQTTILGTATLNGSGVATFPTTSLAPGTYSIVASYPSDTNNLAASSAPLLITINKTPTTTTLSPINSNPSPSATFGTSFTFQATVSNGNSSAIPTGTVTFSDNNGVSTYTSPAVPLVNGVASYPATLSTGTHTITASYTGDTDDAISTSSSTTFVVTPLPTATTVTGSSTGNAGALLSLTATVAPTSGTTAVGGPLTGTVEFFDNGVSISGQLPLTTSGGISTATLQISTLSPGTPSATHPITAVYTGTANSGNANSNYANSTSSPFLQVVTQNTTVTTVSSNTNPVVAGKSVTLTAIVVSKGPPGSPTPTGTVEFTLGATILGQVSLNSGQATLPLPSLSPGANQAIVATYSGDTNDTGGSGTFNQTVTIAQTQLTLSTSAPSGTLFGNSITFTATLTGNGGQPGGAINFADGSTPLGGFTPTANGTVTFTTSSLSVGSHIITASYAGDTNDSPTTSSSITEQIQKLPTSMTLVSGSNPGVYTQPITFTATIASDNAAPTGTITFQNGTTVIGSAPIIANGATASGTATLTLSNLPLGNSSIVATYAGDTNHLNSQSNTIGQQVLQAASVVVTSSNPSSVAETNVVFTADVAGVRDLLPTGTVTFKDGAAVLGTSAVSAAAGTAAATGVASFPISTLSPGAHSIVASYSGDTNYQPGNSPAFTQTVIVANTSVSLASSSNPATFGTALTFTSNVTGTGGSVTGTVTFMDGNTAIGKVAINGSGAATLTTTTLAPGQHTITAVYSGDANNQPNTSSVLQQQVQQTTVSTIVSNANPAQTLSPIVLTCVVSNGGPQPATGSVTFTDGSTLLGTVALTGGVATLSLPSLAAGQHNVIASYSGDVADFPSASAPFAQVVQLRPTTDVLTATTTSLTDGKQLTLISVVRWSGAVTPTGTVNFTIGNTVIGTATLDNIGVATLTIVLDPGSATIVAGYSGDSVYAASNSPATGVTDGPPTSFTLQLSNSSPTVQSKQNVTVDLTVASLNGFTDNLTLGCLGLPFAATCTFSTTQPTLQPNTTETIHVVIDTSAPLLAGTQAQTSGFAGSSKSTVIVALSCSFLLGFLLMRSRKRHPLAGILVLLCSVALVAGLSGCGTLNLSGTPAGTYTFKVTASGIKTGITQSADVTLTVQQ
jgi:sugar lactone lactonase YvrE